MLPELQWWQSLILLSIPVLTGLCFLQVLVDELALTIKAIVLSVLIALAVIQRFAFLGIQELDSQSLASEAPT